MINNLLISALIGAFGNAGSGQILRFARRWAGERIGLVLEKQKSNGLRAELFARDLEDSGKLSEELFDALAQLRPENAPIVERAREAWRAEQQRSESLSFPASGSASSPDPWLADLETALRAIETPPSGPPQDYVDAAALLPSFKPRMLSAIAVEDTEAARDGLTRMASLVDDDSDGCWVLKPRVRRTTIARMEKDGTLSRGIELARQLDRDQKFGLYFSVLEEIVQNGSVKIGPRVPHERLLAARAIGDWFHEVADPPVNLDRLSVILEAREKIEPLRKLAGSHFRGRDEELALLRDPEGFGPNHKRVLAITGIGGSGKSAVIGRHLLSLLDQPLPGPWAYLDLDRGEVDITSPRKLIERIARNLGLLYAGLDDAETRGFNALESFAASDVVEDVFKSWLPTGDSDEALLEALNLRIEQLGAGDLLLVFDTFEQAAVRGPDVINNFAKFIELVLAKIPRARIVFSGRGSIPMPLDMESRQLKDLDEKSADSVLKSYGIEDAAFRQRILKVMGRNPLSLRLASAAFTSKRLSPEDLDTFEAEAKSTQLQGMLYTRVLGHIRDPEIERIAHPGIVVRRVTMQVIQKVLADVCEINAAHAPIIFARLPNHVELFEPVREPLAGGALASASTLRHRQDLREALIEVMLDDPRWKDDIPLIHQRAVDYYEGSRGLIARVEELYHRLMLDQDPEILDPLWQRAYAEQKLTADADQFLTRSLAPAWFEKLPTRARRWLAPRLGYDFLEDGRDIRLVDWEIRTARIARARLDSGDAQGALTVLAERPDRSPASPLTALEAEALSRTGRLTDALQKIDEGLLSGVTHQEVPQAYRLALHLLAADTAVAAGALEAASTHAHAALNLAPRTELSSRLRALDVLVRARHDPVTMKQLEETFVGAPEQRVRLDEATAARVVGTVGASSTAVLAKAARTFGDRPDQKLMSEDLTPWTSLFETVAQKDGGQRFLIECAPRLGLASNQTDPVTIATEVIRHSLKGETLGKVLSRFGSDEAVRASSLATFVL